MYDTSFICTYHLMEDEDDANNLYQTQLLQAFRLEEYNDTLIGKEVDEIYNSMKALPETIAFLKKLQANHQLTYILQLLGGDDESAFRLLFGYDVFSSMHRCICEFKNQGNITKATYEQLLNKL